MKPIREYIDHATIKESTKFVIQKLINETNYNYFNDPIEKENINKEWQRLIEKLPEPVDEESKLEINRRQLAFKICNFHIIVPENTILDEEYIVSHQYMEDLLIVNDLVRDEVMHYVRNNNLYKPTSIDRDLIELSVDNLFSISRSVSVPIPRFKINSNNEIDPNIYESILSPTSIIPIDYPPTSYRESSRHSRLSSSNYTLKSHTFLTLLQIKAISNENNFADNSLKMNFDKLIIDKAALQTMKPFVFRIPRRDELYFSYEGIVSTYIHHFILHAVMHFFHDDESPKRYQSPCLNSNCSISYNPDNHEFNVPFDIKDQGVFEAYQNRNNQLKDTGFHELINEAIYNCLYCKSHIGFVIDMDCVLVVEIDVGASTRMGRVDSIDGGEYQLPCNIRCLRFSDSKYNLTIILMMLIKDYFDNVNTHKEDQVERLFDTLRLTRQDIVDMKKWQHDFVYLEWASKFSHYHQIENGDYAHNIYSYIIIPKECYEEVHHIKYDVEDLNEADFNTNCPEFCFETYTYFQVDRLDGTMVLKVYNPYVVSERLLCNRQFLESYSIALRSFLYEVRAYRIIAEAPKISGKNGIVENYNSHLYRSGIINWPAIDERYFGFYLLIGYAKHDPYKLKSHNLFMEAQTTLKDIHHNKDRHAEFSCKEANSVASNWPMGE
ncbi:uncharacterized protein RJT21DRAFT_121913 [Scheffersomyces amazonensis]|uniref:uncharacterized protein n=1 Tax=Scheffersomyces amazonensis TaxID=1078765 RepID=UPI00315CFF05